MSPTALPPIYYLRRSDRDNEKLIEYAVSVHHPHSRFSSVEADPHMAFHFA